MNVLEKILEEIEEKFKTADAEKCDCEELCDVEDWYDSGYIDGQLSAHEKCMDIIRSHMGEVPDNNDGWIPVGERLPDESSIYIVSAKEGDREIVTFVKWQNRFKKWDLSGTRAYWRVTAWKPLPKPYKEE